MLLAVSQTRALFDVFGDITNTWSCPSPKGLHQMTLPTSPDKLPTSPDKSWQLLSPTSPDKLPTIPDNYRQYPTNSERPLKSGISLDRISFGGMSFVEWFAKWLRGLTTINNTITTMDAVRKWLISEYLVYLVYRYYNKQTNTKWTRVQTRPRCIYGHAGISHQAFTSILMGPWSNIVWAINQQKAGCLTLVK